MTYLQLVNSVLRRLREDEVTNVSDNSYSKLIGEFVNDAKVQVEEAWNWSALRNTLTVSTTDNIFHYNLTDSKNNITVLDVVNDTSNYFLNYKTAHWFNNAFLNKEVPKGSPKYYSFNGVDDNGDTGIDLYPEPNGLYEIRFNVIQRTQPFTENNDKLTVPSPAVVQLATAMAARERGETGGVSSAELFAIADNTLADAVAYDAAKHPEDTIWTTC
jgi:hypothetical protein